MPVWYNKVPKRLDNSPKLEWVLMSQNNKRSEANREELVERLGNHCTSDGQNDVVESLQFFRYSNPTQPKHGLYSPAMCVVAQGAKEVTFGEERLRYDPA